MIRAIRKARRTIAKGFSPHGPRWRHGMLKYYDERLDFLAESEPEKYVD